LNETAVSPSKGSLPLPPLKKKYHENPWANEFECITSHTHQYCNDYPDLIIDYPFHSFDDDTSELQGAGAEASDTDALRQILTASNLRQAIQAGVKELSSHQENPPLKSDKEPPLTKDKVTNHDVAASDAPDDDHEGQDTSTPRKKRIPKKQKLTISVNADDQQYIPSPTKLKLWKSTVIIALSDPEYYIQPSEYEALPHDQRTPEAQVRSLNMAIPPGRAIIPQAVMRHMKQHELVPEDNGKSLTNTTTKAMTNTTTWYMHMELPANERQNFNYYQSVLSQTGNKITVQVRIGQQDYPLNLKIILREDDNPESEEGYKFIAKWPEYEGFKVYNLSLIIPPSLIKIYSQAYPEQIFDFTMDLDERRDTPQYTPAIYGPVKPGEIIKESGNWIINRQQTYNTLSSCGTVIPKDANAIILTVKKKTLDILGCPDLQTAIAPYGKLVLFNSNTQERRATRVEVNLLGTTHKDLETRHICRQGRCTHSHKLHKESGQLIPYVPSQDCPFHIRGTIYCNRCMDDLGQKGTTPDQVKEFFTKLVKQSISYLHHLDTTHITLPIKNRMLTPALKKTSNCTILRSLNLTSPQSPMYLKQRPYMLNRRQLKQWKPNRSRSKLMKILPFSYFGTEKPRPCSESPKPSKQNKNGGKILDLRLRPELRPISSTLLPILSQELLQIRYQQHRGPPSILSRESRLHLRNDDV
jgi:hypothetical protein